MNTVVHRRPFAILIAVGAIALVLTAIPRGNEGARAQSFTDSVSDKSVFYRLQASYLYAGQKVDFDIVVGCAVRVTSHGDNSSSYDAFRDPVLYAIATEDGGAIAQIIPDACRGDTTTNGEVPADFLPGAIWFDSKNDFSFGIAYVTEDAFENSRAKLKFLGARIESATREEWQDFRSKAASQNLVDSREFTHVPEQPAEQEVRAHLWDKKMLAKWTRFSMRCHAYQKFELTDPAARKAIAEYWPKSRPRFWSPGYPGLAELNKRIHFSGSLEVNHHPLKEFSQWGLIASGFPTRARGGMLGSGQPWSLLPATIFPFRGDDGVPWARPEVETASTIYRDIDADGGANFGFAYCYSRYFGSSPIGQLHLPNYGERNFVIRIDGMPIEIEGRPGVSPADVPRYFFENDQWMYRSVGFILS